MKFKIVAIRDRAVDVFSVPVFVASIGAAVRSFGDEVKRPHSDERPNQLNAHPEDFDLFHLGDFDDNDGSFSTLVLPERIAVGSDYK